MNGAENFVETEPVLHREHKFGEQVAGMDDDVLRRGKPTCHVEFDEATALLVGDALQSLAFQLLSEYRLTEDPAAQLEMVKLLAAASGSRGMGDIVGLVEEVQKGVDMRDFKVGAHILFDLGARQVRLMTNNPDKVKALEDYGLKVTERVALEISPRSANRNYLQTKRTKFGHLLSLGEKQD